MPVSNSHPLYNEYLNYWEVCRDCYVPNGVKAKGDTYLPATSGHIMDGYPTEGSLGAKAYRAYWLRAYFPDIFSEAVAAAVGIMHKKEAVIELPTILEPMRDRANAIGESLQMILRRIKTEQLVTGRLGLLADLKVKDDLQSVDPVVVMYKDTRVLNWDDISTDSDVGDFRLVVLDETGSELQPDLSWKLVEKFLVLGLIKNNNLDSTGVYQYATAEKNNELADLEFSTPVYKGTASKSIPFTTINACDINPSPDYPPLIGLANLCLTIYRGEADYRHSLFMQGQDTLVKIGDLNSDETTRVGAGACINVPVNGDAKYIGVNSEGLSEQRSCLENDYKRAYSKSGQITDTTSRAKESGDALRIRVAAQSATLPQIAMAGAMGLERVLKILAEWLGANPDEVKVTPNLDFTNEEFPGKTLVEIVQAKIQGAPLSNESIHAYMRERNLTKKTFEEELAAIQSEEPLL